MKKKITLLNTVIQSFYLYKITLQYSFILALIPTTIYNIYILYINNNNNKNIFNVTNYIFMMLLTIITIYSQGLLICIAHLYKDNVNIKIIIKNSFLFLYKKIYIFLLIYLLYSLLLFISLCNIFFFWIINSFTLILLPMSLLYKDNISIFNIFKINFNILLNNIFYSLQAGIVIILLFIIRDIIYMTLSIVFNDLDNIFIGIKSLLLVVMESFILPFIIIFMVSIYYELLGEKNNKSL